MKSIVAPNRPMSPKALKKFALGLFKQWQKLQDAAKLDSYLKPSADQLYKLYADLHQIACQRETLAAERKDRKLGNPVMWEVFRPDNILGMEITTRTPHRVIEQRIPTGLDIIGMALFGSKKDLERYQPKARAVAACFDPWQDLDNKLHGYGYDPEKAIAKTLQRIDEVLILWRTRFDRERAEEARRQQQERWVA